VGTLAINTLWPVGHGDETNLRKMQVTIDRRGLDKTMTRDRPLKNKNVYRNGRDIGFGK